MKDSLCERNIKYMQTGCLAYIVKIKFLEKTFILRNKPKINYPPYYSIQRQRGRGYKLGNKEMKILCYTNDAVLRALNEDDLER